MRIPLRIEYENVMPSNATAECIRKLLWQLEARFPRVESCEVVISDPTGEHLEVRLELPTSRRWVVVERGASQRVATLPALLSEAFDAAWLQLEAVSVGGAVPAPMA